MARLEMVSFYLLFISVCISRIGKGAMFFFFFFWSYELSYNAKYYPLITVPCLFIIYDEEQVEWLTHGLSVERDDSNSILNARVDNT